MLESKLKVLELFAGIGACSKALTNLGIEHEIVDAVEIDKYAVQSFNAIHGTNFEPQDITKWDKDIECDLIMHGSPCQDFSVAGKGAGGDKDSGTRSSLMYETLRIVEKLKPKYVVWENVKNLLSKKHRHNFDAYLDAMEALGYSSKYQVLNAKDYGVPQNRERVFTVSIKNTITSAAFVMPDGTKKPIIYSEIDSFSFPAPTELKIRLKDVLEQEVDEKYYLSDEQTSKLRAKVGQLYGLGNQEPKIVASRGRGESNEQRLEARKDGLTNTITSVAKDNYLAIKNATKRGYLEAYDGDGIDCQYLSSTMRRGRVQHGMSQTIPSTTAGVGVNDSMRIRKLTPKECWRLMGFGDKDFDRAKASGVSNSQLYKQAGNSIVVNVLEGILRNLLTSQ